MNAAKVLEQSPGPGRLEPVLVVTAPKLPAERLDQLRRSIARQLRERLWVVPDGVRWSVELLPVGAEAVLLRTADPPPEASGQEQEDTSRKEAAEKRRILERLQAYRRDKGLGCFGPVAAKCRRWKVTPELLRSALFEGGAISMEQLRAVDRALDKIMLEDPENGPAGREGTEGAPERE